MRHALAVAVLIAAPLCAKAPLFEVALQWKPTRTTTELGLPAVNLLPFQGKTFALAPFRDTRKEPALIGENREKAVVRRVTTRDQVPVWLTTQSRTFLTKLGLPLVDAGAATTINAEVTSFFVAEGGDYLGDVAFKVQIQKDGKTLWTGMAIGAAKRFGRSYKLDNYQETLSDSFLEAWISLLKSPDFLSALAQ